MSQFLNNLIHRHQASNDNLEASHIVQPRPKSRFETLLSAGEPLNQHEVEIEPITRVTSKQSSSNTAPPPQTDMAKINPSIYRHTDDEKNIKSALTLPNEHEFITQEISNSTSQDEHYQQSKGQAKSDLKIKRSPRITEQPKSQNLSTADKLNQNIQTILQRLNNQKPRSYNEPPASENQLGITLPSTINSLEDNALPEVKEQSFMPKQAFTLEQKDKVKEKVVEKLARQRETHQVGLLQLPGWLAEMKSNLNGRWREINAEEKSETVVNVTIGRVEVKAIQTDEAKPQKANNKPSGIMSLDDYLSQRNKGRS